MARRVMCRIKSDLPEQYESEVRTFVSEYTQQVRTMMGQGKPFDMTPVLAALQERAKTFELIGCFLRCLVTQGQEAVEAFPVVIQFSMVGRQAPYELKLITVIEED